MIGRKATRTFVHWGCIVSFCIAGDRLSAIPFYEPFSLPAGTNLVPNPPNPNGQTNSWYAISTASGTNQITIDAGSLYKAGLAQSLCNRARFGGLGSGARVNLFPSGGAMTSGTLFFSFILRVTDLNGLSDVAEIIAGFNNSLNGQTTQPTVIGNQVLLRAVVTEGVTNGFNIGLTKRSTLTTDWVWWRPEVSPTVFTTNDTIFIIGRYQFNTVGDQFDDLAILWVNPDPSTFGNPTEPQTGITTMAGQDLTQIASFLLLQRTNSPAGILIDELRFGTSWAQIAPAYAVFPRPPLSLASAGTNLLLSWATNAACFALETTPALTISNIWTPVAQPVVVVGDQNTVTIAPSGTNQFFRLRGP